MKQLNYFERRDKIYELFGKDIYQRYPLSSRVLNRFIRSKIHYGDLETESIKTEFQHDRGLKGFKKSLTYRLLCLLNLSLFRFKRNNQEKVLVSPSIFGRFEILGKQFKDHYNVYTLLCRKDVHFVLKSKIKDMIKIDQITFSRKLQKLLPKIATSISKFIDNEKELNKRILFQKLDVLEKTLSREVAKLSQLFINKKIKLYITAFDQIYNDTFSILACQKTGIKTKCIAHGGSTSGNIKTRPKTGCLPVIADKLYVWSQENYDSFKGYEEMKKIRIGGYPKFSKEYIEKMAKKYPKKKIITFYSEYILFDKRWMEAESKMREKLFKELKEIATKLRYQIYVRYHDKREEKVIRKEKKLLKECGIKISRNPFIKDILQSEINLGIDTSCLYEAKILGRRSFQLLLGDNEYDRIYFMKNYFMKNIEYINIDDIEKKLKEKVNNKPRYDLLMDVDSIINDP